MLPLIVGVSDQCMLSTAVSQNPKLILTSDMPRAMVGLGRPSIMEGWEEVLGTGGPWQKFVWLVRKLFTSSQLGTFSGVTNSQPGLVHF